MMSLSSTRLRLVAVTLIILTAFYVIHFSNFHGNLFKFSSTTKLRSFSPSNFSLGHQCICPKGSELLKDYIPEDQYEELVKRRVKELQQYKTRMASELSRLLFASPNSPLQYPIQGYIVRPLTSTLIPGLGLHAENRSSYKVSLSVSKGILTTNITPEQTIIKRSGKNKLIIESRSLVTLNNLLAKVSYTSTDYHINTGDLDISSQVTITTKTFQRYKHLRVLLDSIRQFYSNIKIIVADDSLETEHITGENIQHYIMPPAQGWFAGRNLAVSQVTTKYFLWVDDDFVLTEKTKIENLVEVMEAMPELDVVGGSVKGNQFYFALIYEEGEEIEGGCLYRKSGGKFQSLPGYPQCSMTSGVVNFFLARTDAVQRVGFDPKLQRTAHSEFFMDGLGTLLVATCGDVSIDHQLTTSENKSPLYNKFRYPGQGDVEFKLKLHFYKNHLKCIKYG
ncbi:beta-1,4 N-acetylgalactosaminyltransferase 2 isoform X3 [Oreochromis niloticus]|uniref:beta-1,4 N-acetylgalactosaminyltransferase 2 isoform X3 n=1 Tax=Oreochromis niloticus TaxID=8128 RepID=UPI00090593CD|nr:beta-1,4 N-acetylgalactosaminyltransferase 2 isoform X3 [Oreochromis niloticus]